MTPKSILKLSRPRFWLYLAGPYLIGYTIAATTKSDFLTWHFWYPLIYFLLPANIFLYGINDVYDTATDRINPKKQKQKQKHIYEQRFDEHDVPRVYKSIVLLTFFTSLLFLLLFLPGTVEKSLLLLFLFLSYAYSASPIRFKARLWFDSASNILYALPGFIGYAQLTHRLPPLSIILLCFCWTSAMHLFSAIPDIEYDRKARIATTATRLGKPISLMVCTVLWSAAAVIALSFSPFFALMWVYPLIPLLLLSNQKLAVIKIYWWFPYINGLLGFLLFWFFAWQLL